jgi:phosphohistidine phosphatase
MELYLVQHGEAKPESEDPERPLTERGRREVERVARHAARTGARPAEIRHSGRRRAEETAALLARHLRPARGVRAVAGLGPNDDPAATREAIEREAEPLCIVGHLPHLSRLASLLLAGDPEREILAFRMGGMVYLERADGRWRVRWAVVPEVAPE